MHLWSPPSIFWSKEPALGSPRNQMKMIQDWDFHGGCAWSWRKMASCSQQCCCPPDVSAFQMCAHQNVGWGVPSPQLFLHHLCPLCLGGVWGGLGLFTGVFLPLVELGHSGRRAGVSVGWMGTHCAAPRVKKVSLREMMEIKIKRTEPMSGWTDI